MARPEYALLVLLGLASCREEHEPLLERVEFSGCREVLVGRICELEDTAKLVLWVKAKPDAELTVLANDAESAVEWASIDGGVTTELTVTTSTRAIEIRAKRRGVDRWRLPIRVWERPTGLREAERAFSAGKIDDAERALAAIPPTDDPRIQIELASRRSAIAMGRGDHAAAMEHREKAAQIADRAGVISRSVNDRLSVAYSALLERDFARVRRMIDETAALPLDDFPPSAANLAYYRGVLAEETGDYRTALQTLETAERSAARLGMRSTWSFAVQVRAFALAGLGMHQAAVNHLAQLDVGANADCAAAAIHNNRAWLALTANELGTPTNLDAVASAERALEIFSGPCPQPVEVRNVLVNLALAEVQRGDLESARRRVEQARALGEMLTPFVMLWLLDVEARIELAGGRFGRAMKGYDDLYALARRTGSKDAEWRAWVGRAQVHRAVGRPREATAAYAEAESLLETQGFAISIGDERSSFLASRGRAVEAHLELLVEEQHTIEAVSLIRRSRARAVRALQTELRVASLSGEDRGRWERAIARYLKLRDQLDASRAQEWNAAASREVEQREQRAVLEEALSKALEEALAIVGREASSLPARAPESGEVIIGFHRAPSGWIGFSSSSPGIRVVSLPDRRDKLLEPFDAELEHASRVRFLVDGPLARVDFHAFMWRGAPLIQTHAVAYGVDVPRAARTDPSSAQAVVVADPLGDLPAARDEAATVVKLLKDKGTRAVLLSSQEATRKNVVAALQGASLFHYAGHGAFGGQSVWESVLPLADSGGLRVGDILALPTVPRAVVLSGCETAETSELTGQQLGLAQAFVLNGAEAVIAANRRVSDELARRIAERVHLESAPLPEALQRAQQAVMKETPDMDWAAFRAIVP